MIKYIGTSTSRDLVKFNVESQEADVISNICSDIDYAWVVPEDGIFDGKEVKKGEIIARMYGIYDETKDMRVREFIIIKDPVLTDYIKRSKESEDRLRAKRNGSNVQPCCNECCDECAG